MHSETVKLDGVHFIMTDKRYLEYARPTNTWQSYFTRTHWKP